jgi:hypothetical protein
MYNKPDLLFEKTVDKRTITTTHIESVMTNHAPYDRCSVLHFFWMCAMHCFLTSGDFPLIIVATLAVDKSRSGVISQKKNTGKVANR